MERKVVCKMIDLTQFMLMESTGDSEAKSDNDTGSFPRCSQEFLAKFDDEYHDNDNNEQDDDDAESCSYGSSHGGSADGFCHNKKKLLQNNDDDDDEDDGDDGMSYNGDNNNNNNDDEEMEEDDDDDDDDDDDAISSKMVEVSKKCGAFVMGRRQEKRDCSNTKFLNEEENDKNFWDTCLAS